jgi:hypothetical protein
MKIRMRTFLQKHVPNVRFYWLTLISTVSPAMVMIAPRCSSRRMMTPFAFFKKMPRLG